MVKVKFDIMLEYIHGKLIVYQQKFKNSSECINSVLNCAINFRDLEFIESVDIALESTNLIFNFKK